MLQDYVPNDGTENKYDGTLEERERRGLRSLGKVSEGVRNADGSYLVGLAWWTGEESSFK